MGNLEKILVGIIIVTIVAILGLAIWGLGGHDNSKHPTGSAPATLVPEKDPIPEAESVAPAITEIPSEPSVTAANDVAKMAANIERLASDGSHSVSTPATSSPSPSAPSSAAEIPAPEKRPKLDPYPTLAERVRKYVVKKGDTYEKIARSELGDGKKWTLVQEMNKDVPPSKLYPGSTIVLPSEDDVASFKPRTATPTKELTRSEPPTAAENGSIHTVKKGETLYSIAREYLHDGAKWRLIADANPGKVRGASEIAAGSRLRIPRN